MIARGSVCQVEEPGVAGRSPVLVVQSEPFNRSRIPTLLVIPLSIQTHLAEAPGNVLVPAAASGLLRNTVAVVSGIHPSERASLRETQGRLSAPLLEAIDQGLRLVLGL